MLFQKGEMMNPTIYSDINQERKRQDTKWGEQNHNPYKWLAILHEETGEAAKALLEGSLLNYRDEMIQVAAVAIAAIECLDRGKWDARKECS